MNLKNHYKFSKIGYLASGMWIFLFSVRYLWFYPEYSEALLFISVGVLFMMISFLVSKIWQLQNTDSHIEHWIESQIRKKKR